MKTANTASKRSFFILHYVALPTQGSLGLPEIVKSGNREKPAKQAFASNRRGAENGFSTAKRMPKTFDNCRWISRLRKRGASRSSRAENEPIESFEFHDALK